MRTQPLIRSSVILRTDESSDALVVSNLSNFVQYPFCSAVWPVLVSLAAGIRRQSWIMVVLSNPRSYYISRCVVFRIRFRGFHSSGECLLDAYRLGIGDEFLPFISINTSKSNFIAALAASANEDHETAHKLASTVSVDQYPQICVLKPVLHDTVHQYWLKISLRKQVVWKPFTEAFLMMTT